MASKKKKAARKKAPAKTRRARKHTSGYDLCVAELRKNPKVDYATVKEKADKQRIKISPIVYGRAKATLGLVSVAKRGKSKAAQKARSKRDPGRVRKKPSKRVRVVANRPNESIVVGDPRLEYLISTLDWNRRHAFDWYLQTAPELAEVGSRAAQILKRRLREAGVDYFEIRQRTKKADSLIHKLHLIQVFEEPYSRYLPIHDISGIRVIAYYQHDLQFICDLVERYFEIDSDNSSNKSDVLGVDRIGYKSIHYVATLREEDLDDQGAKRIRSLRFEIQVRTILEHAWAELSHRKVYKVCGDPPHRLRRRLNLLSGLLENADRELSEVVSEVDSYWDSIRTRIGVGDLDIPLDSGTVIPYMKKKFGSLIADNPKLELSQDEGMGVLVPIFLSRLGIKTVADFDSIVPNDFVRAASQFARGEFESFSAVILFVLLIHDVDKYFKVHWDVSLSEGWGGDVKDLLDHYGVSAAEIYRRHGYIMYDRNW